MKARFSWLALALAGATFSAPGCSGGGAHAPLRIELAPTLDCSQETADFPADLRFFVVQICTSPSMGMPGHVCAPLTDPGGDHSGGSTSLRVARSLERSFSVDARLDPSLSYDVTITGYSGAETGTCTPYALGHALGVRFGQDDIRVRLYPLGGWSCAGTHEGATASVPRALHQAVLLPDGEVLILGGVVGPTAGAAAFAHPSLAQRLVEVFDPRDARFHPVAMADEDGTDGFSRVMFQARYVSTNAMGQYEIHTYGGFDVDHAPDGGIGFDGNASAVTVSALFGPLSHMMMGEAAGFRSDAVILYDPHTRSATVTAHASGNYTTTAASEGSASIAVVRSIDSVTVPATGMGYPTYGITAGWYVDGGRQGQLTANRLGSSITPLSATNFLIWGGHVSNNMDMVLDAAEVIGDAGEVVSAMATTDTLVPAHDPASIPDDNRPFATAYHTATHIAGLTGSTAILFAGGIMLNPMGLGAPLGAQPFASPALTIARFGNDGSFVGGARITGRNPTALQTANVVDASATDVLLVGGASQMTVSGVLTTLFGERTVGLVRFDPATSTYAWHALPDIISGRCAHTTTIIPNHGVLVVGGISRVDGTLTISDSSELLLWEDLRSAGRPATMNCAMATDAGAPSIDAAIDAPRSDTGPQPDAGDAGAPSTDAASATGG